VSHSAHGDDRAPTVSDFAAKSSNRCSLPLG
jgi:hypothetical protein